MIEKIDFSVDLQALLQIGICWMQLCFWAAYKQTEDAGRAATIGSKNMGQQPNIVAPTPRKHQTN